MANRTQWAAAWRVAKFHLAASMSTSDWMTVLGLWPGCVGESRILIRESRWGSVEWIGGVDRWSGVEWSRMR